MAIRKITILLFLSIFGIVTQGWPENQRENQGLKLMESIDRIFSPYGIGESSWRYPFLDPQGVKETKSPRSDFSPSVSALHPESDRYVEERGPKVIFELLQSNLRKAEIFILFHLSFNPKGDQVFLGTHITPFSAQGVDFLIPFNPNPFQ